MQYDHVKDANYLSSKHHQILMEILSWILNPSTYQSILENIYKTSIDNLNPYLNEVLGHKYSILFETNYHYMKVKIFIFIKSWFLIEKRLRITYMDNVWIPHPYLCSGPAVHSVGGDTLIQ